LKEGRLIILSEIESMIAPNFSRMNDNNFRERSAYDAFAELAGSVGR
jgi:hypothetical protein